MLCYQKLITIPEITTQAFVVYINDVSKPKEPEAVLAESILISTKACYHCHLEYRDDKDFYR